ncbi:MAG: hypothetical protein ACOX3T_00240, partial [Bdellovibrionota bacterium]
SCTDSDGGNVPSVLGSTTYTKGTRSIKNSDYCLSSTTLAEQVCVAKPKFGAGNKALEGRGMVKVNCQYGCENGACKPECVEDADCGDGNKCVDNKCVPKGECEDGKDNDGDGLVDSKDPGCQGCTGSNCSENKAYSCTDSDGGNVPNVLGSTTYTKGKRSIKNSDYCLSSTTLAEQVCVAKPKFGAGNKALEGRGMVKVNCQYGCENGACKPECVEDADCGDGNKCVDNKCVPKGECEDGKDNDGDGLVDSKDPGCQGCTGSNCSENKTYSCTDSDGENVPSVLGSTTYTKGSGKISNTDYCLSSTTLAEQVCVAKPKFGAGNKALEGRGMVKVNCQYGCENGACKPQCVEDSDCGDGNKCVDNKCVPKGECEDGKDNDGDGLVDSKDPGCQGCTGSNCSENKTYSCTDSDGGNVPNVLGSTTYTKGSGKISNTDYCLSSTTLAEQVCVAKPKFGAGNKALEGRGMVKVNCQYGCENGACKPECVEDSDCGDGNKCVDNKCVPKGECEDGKDNDGDGLVDSKDPGCQGCTGSNCSENKTYSCTDSDGGNVPNVLGSTTYTKGSGKISNTDYCLSSTTLAEQVCVAKPKFGAGNKALEGRGMVKVNCQYGCDNGACKPECVEDADCGDGNKCVDNKCVPKGECEDGKDNDGDGLVDSKDPGCQGCTGSNCSENKAYSCTDSDGGNVPSVLGSTTYTKGSGKISNTDYCLSSTTLAEQVCVAKPKFGAGNKALEGRGMVKVNCQYGCENGACKPECVEDADCGDNQKCVDNKCIDTTSAITPILECVMNNEDDTYTAYFGYENTNDKVVAVDACKTSSDTRNVITGLSANYCNQPSTFEKGRVKGAFSVSFNKTQTLTWTLKNNSEAAKIATANASSTPCAKVAPIAKCISINPDASLQAYFGYKNNNAFEVKIPVGIKNNVNPDPEDRGQPENFISGNVENAFDTKLDIPSTSWYLDGVSVVANKSLPTCQPNNAPICDGANEVVYNTECQGSVTTLDISANCVDPDGTKLIYSWTTNCENSVLSNESTATPTLTLTNPGTGVSQSCQVSLNVSDGLASTNITQNVYAAACEIDCFGVPGGSARLDVCGVCDGDGTSCLDCAGVPFGNAKYDLCGVCNGNNKCVDCAGVPYGDAKLDRCGVCNGDGTSCLGCVDVNIKGDKASLHGDEFVSMLIAQTELLLKESNPYPQIKNIQASAKRRINRANKRNAQLKTIIASLSDVMQSCTNTTYCVQGDNQPKLELIERHLRKLRRQVGRTVRQRNIGSQTATELLNKNAKILSGKLSVLARIPRFYSECN